MGQKSVKPQPTVTSKEVTYALGPEFASTFKKFKQAGQGTRLLKALEKFQQLKSQNPQQQYGGSDKPFTGGGNFSGLSHAHLTHDVSLVYRWDSAHREFKLYGFYTHDDLGTGTPPQLRKQENVGGRLQGQVFENH